LDTVTAVLTRCSLLLKAHPIEILIDIRAFPRSRRHPHFDRAMLSAILAKQGVDYQWLGDVLGGYRKPRRDSPHTALTDAAFRGFADYMGTEKFTHGIERLASLAQACTCHPHVCRKRFPTLSSAVYCRPYAGAGNAGTTYRQSGRTRRASLKRMPG